MIEQFYDIQRSARSLVRDVDAPPYIASENPVETTQLKAGVGYHWLYSTVALHHPDKLDEIGQCQALGEQSRLLADPPMKLLLTDEHTGAASALLVRPSALLDGLLRMYEVLWRFAVKLDARDHSRTAAGRPTADESILLAMLAAGMTDRQIAERSGFSTRTAQTRVQRRMDTLGADTRFQAGLEAKARGWL